jgi:hypothetical protein
VTDHVRQNLVTSRLLILQSKRILLSRAHSRVDRQGGDQRRVDLEARETAVQQARERYNDAVLKWAPNESNQYRLVAYGSLIATAERLRAGLRQTTGALATADRLEAMADLRSLEAILEGWRGIARDSMATAVA